MLEMLNEIINNPSSVVALCAVIISVISVLISIMSSYQSRKFNRLSVRPLAYVLPPDYENRIAVILLNKGTGPLITKKVRFINKLGEEKNSLIDFMPELDDGFYWSTFSKASKIILSPNEETTLIEFTGDPSDIRYLNQRDKIRKSLSELKIKIEYTSIFKESKPFKLNYNLTWFSR